MRPMMKHSLLLLVATALIRANAFVTPNNRKTVLKKTALPISSTESNNKSQAASQNVFGVVSDAVTGAAFDVLHAFDDDPIKDSSKNLRVLWVRALLNQRGLIQDDVAATFLPPTTRGLVTTNAGSNLFDPVVKFTEWIQARTEFIEGALEHFLTSPACTDATTGQALECNVVLFGAGYDTRAIRYRHEHDEKINFVEVDLPQVTAGKQTLYENFQKNHDPDWDLTNKGPRLVPLDLNDCGGENPASLIETLREKGGLKQGIPTLFVWEAVLFYVNEDAVRNIMDELFTFAASGTETLLCMTDPLKPFVDVPFSNEARIFFDSIANMELLEHRSRWGGAVHFCLAASRKKNTQDNDESRDGKAATAKGEIAKHINDRVGGLVFSYTPTQSNNPDLLRKPSFENVWYAVAYPWQIDGYESPLDAVLSRKTNKKRKPFATRLWGEPLVVYRDNNGELVAMADVCPHRSVPLSMGQVEKGELVCMYHGWRFGPKGDCVHVPTLKTVDETTGSVVSGGDDSRFLNKVTDANCGNHRAAVEHEGLVYVWRGNVLEADPSLLPSRRKGDMETVPIDTVMDYAVDYSYIVENNLDSPHLFYLHDGSVPPIESIGMLNSNLPKLKLTAFVDDCGMGHLGKLGAGGRPKKILRFDPPNIVRHGGVSGFEEEFHIIPVAPQRTRVLLRQHLPRGPILSTITGIPGMFPMLTLLVNNWNYHISLEDSVVMQGQANRIEDWRSPRMIMGGLGDDLIKRFWSWRAKAHKNYQAKHKDDMASPYLVDFTQNGGPVPSGIPTGTSFGDDPELVSKFRKEARLQNKPLVNDDHVLSIQQQATQSDHGVLSNRQPNRIMGYIKQTYLQETPAANFPPMNYKQYANLLVFDNFVKNLFERKEEPAPVIMVAAATSDDFCGMNATAVPSR